MPSPARRLRRARVVTVGLAASAVALSAGVPHQADARMSVIYAGDPAAREILTPGRPGGLGIEDNVFRQQPSGSGLFRGPDGHAHRMAKISGAGLARMSAKEMVTALRTRIDGGCGAFRCASHLVAVDELTPAFSDGKVSFSRRTVRVRGKRIRVAPWNRVKVTRRGYRIVRRDPPLPEVTRASPARRLARAMAALARVDSPYGGTYAERVHLYVSPAFVTSVGLGRGRHRTLGQDGKPHRRSFRGVMPALVHAGGVWLEMYHGSPGSAGTTPFTAEEWRVVPARFASYFNRFGGERSRLHFMLADAATRPAGAPASCGDGHPMRCQWELADRPGASRAILLNGVGAYSVGGQAGVWREEYLSRVRPRPVLYAD
jgi:hypothetical protein